jgi:hypothetical protein
MPRSLLVLPKGGVTGKVRRRYAVIKKIMLLEEWGRLQLERNLTLRAAADEVGVNVCLLSKWTKDVEWLCTNKKSCKHALVNGPNGQLHSIEEELLQ